MNHIWDNWSNESSEKEVEVLVVERRQYKMLERIDLDKWDDFDFIFRFRLSKPSVLKVLDLIGPNLEHCSERLVLFFFIIIIIFVLFRCVILLFRCVLLGRVISGQ